MTSCELTDNDVGEMIGTALSYVPILCPQRRDASGRKSPIELAVTNESEVPRQPRGIVTCEKAQEGNPRCDTCKVRRGIRVTLAQRPRLN